jgi:hypothetical protein
MYQLTYDSKILFDPYMQSTAITDAKYTGKSNSVSYLDFSIAPNHPLYNTIEKDKGLVEFYSDNVLKFRGKINEIEIDDYGYKIVACNSVLQYLNHTRVRSYSTVPGDADLTAPTSVEGYFQWLIDQHNLHVKDASERFEVGVNQGAALDKNDYILRSNDGYPTTLDEINDKVLDSLGGYLFVEYKDDRNILNLYADVHSTNSQIIDFGSNILSISYKENDDELYTVVIPRGGTPEKKEGDTKDPKPINIKNLPDNTFDTDSDIVKSGDCVYSLSATKRYGYREYYYSNNDILDPSNLLKAAVLQLRLQMSPKVTIETKAIDLSIAYPGYEQLNIGDACRVRSARHNLDDYFMLSEMELDLNDPSQTTYTFGDEYVSLVGRQSNYLKQINSSIDRNYEDVNTAMSYGKAAAKLADTANKTADAANNTAVKANDKAQKATEDAFNANTTANKAQSTANTANTTANKAQTTATEASKTATEAKTTADSANKAAEELKKKTAEIDKQVEAASAKADQVRTDLTQQVQNVKSEMDTAVEAAQTSANKAQSAADAAQKAADKANASTVDLDKSIKAVDAKAIAAKQAAAEAQSKAENVASDLDSANAVIEQHTTELGELTTKVTNAVKKSDSALSVSTEAKQTATEASTTATSAYKDSQTALTQSTTATQTATAAKTTAESASKTASDSLKQSSAAVQTANQISTTLRTEYQTKADADKIYATQSSLKQTSDSITASVSKTYATKDALSALQNVADNAIESWRGTGVPTLTNKPASDWTTNAEKKKHSGDLYYDKSTGKAYRFGSDDGETYTWELNQDTDVTKALEDAANAQTSANNAQASATAANTAAGKAQSTANTAVSNAATAKNAADAAQSSANKAQGDVDKLKIDIPETYATKSSLTQTAESITANVESVKTTANSAVTAASKAQQTADSISVNLTKNYQTKSQADTLYATKASLKATSDSISAEVTKAQGTADGAVTAASKAQQTADAVTLNLSKNYNTKAQNDAVYATQTSLKATSDSLSANITANAKTAQSAVDKATSLEANLNGFKTTVSQTYGHGSNLWVNPTFDADKPQIGSRVDDVTAPNGSGVNLLAKTHHYNNATSFPVVPGHIYVITAHIKRLKGNKPLNAGIWYTSQTSGNSWDTYRRYESTSDLSDEWLSATWRFSCPNGKSRGCVAFQIDQSASNDSTQWYVANVVCVDVTGLQPAGDYATNSSLTQTANSIKAEVTEVSKTANGAMSKATTVEQTANGLSSKITEQGKTLNATVKTANEAKSTADAVTLNLSKNYNTKAQNDAVYATQTSLKATSDSLSANITANAKTAQSAVDKATSLEANLNGFKTTVSQTYGHGSNLWVNPTFDADKPQIGSRVDDVTAPNGSGVNLLAKTHHYNNATSFPVVPGHIYVITAHIKRLKGNKPLNAGIWYTSQTSGNSWDTYRRYESTSDLSDEWLSATWRFSCPNGKSRGCVAFQIDQSASNDSTQWYVANVVCVDVTGLQPAGDYATNSSLTQTANSIKAEVTEVSKTANGAMSKATTVEQTANGLSSKITEQGKTLNATVKTANEAKSTADSNKATISQTANLVDAALAGDNLITDGGFESTEWWNGLKNPFRISIGSFYHGKHVLVCDAATGDNRCPLTHEKGMAGSATTIPVTKGRTYRLSGYCAWYLSVPSNVNPSSEKLRLAKPDGSFIAGAPCSKSTSWSETHVDWKCPDDGSITSVKIEVMHQTNGAIMWDDVAFRDITEAAATSNRVSSVEQNLNGFKTTVTETYQTKDGMSNYVTQSQIQQTNDKVTIAFQNSQSVGGQNLLLKTSVPTVVTGSGAANQTVAMYNLAAGNLSNLPAGMYNIQFKIKSDTAGGTAHPQWNDNPWGMGDGITNINIGTSEQTYSKHFYISNTNHSNVKGIAVRLDNAKGKITIREMKLEPGNSMTPWTAALEDTINDLTNTVQNQSTDIANKVSNDDYTGYVNATNKNLSDIQDSQQHLSDSVNNEIKLRESYIQFGQDASNPYMDMGNSSSPNKMRLTNTKLSFTSNNIEVASVSNDKMRISNAEVLQSLCIGNFVWQPRSDGHMALKYSPEV